MLSIVQQQIIKQIYIVLCTYVVAQFSDSTYLEHACSRNRLFCMPFFRAGARCTFEERATRQTRRVPTLTTRADLHVQTRADLHVQTSPKRHTCIRMHAQSHQIGLNDLDPFHEQGSSTSRQRSNARTTRKYVRMALLRSDRCTC